MSANRFRFRAWEAARNRMLYTSRAEPGLYGANETYVDIHYDGGDMVHSQKQILVIHDGVLYEDLPDMGYYGGGEWSYAQGDFVIMQSTGLADKNGKEIFEGDIIKVLDGTISAPVKWDAEGAKFYWEPGEEWGWIPEGREVVGNIHENPELLK